MRRLLAAAVALGSWVTGCSSPAEDPDAAGSADAGIDAAPPADAPPMPNLMLVAQDTIGSVLLETRSFLPDDCTVAEACVDGTGDRRLLRFGITMGNDGPVDLQIGVPGSGDNWAWAPCHSHYHLHGYGELELWQGDTLVRSRHWSFCIQDIEPLEPGGGGSPVYDCYFQGISAGWSCVVDVAVDCQWLDVTGVAPGEYTLRITINKDRALLESTHADNVLNVPVTID